MTAREHEPAAGPRAEMEVHFEVSQFLAREAALLDQHRYSDWFELLADDVIYRMPVAVTVARGAELAPGGSMAHFDEDHYSLSKRVQRLLSERAWTEDPPSRTRRYVTNVVAGPGAAVGELEASSYMLLFRSRLDVRAPEWVSTARRDLLRRAGAGGLVLARREITVDEAVLRTQNLAVFL
ncbi:MAG: 3-phenylpropionate/cinnamic acid dioxygenase subunit beta [Acidimicrobiales bacterium]